MTTEFAWLIEKGPVSEPSYYAPTIPGEWTKDHLKACRFGRKEDAEAIQFRHVTTAQAFQTVFKLSQKSTIGEWVPLDDADPVPPWGRLITSGGKAWQRGLWWSDIEIGHGSVRIKSLGKSARGSEAKLLIDEIERIGAFLTNNPVVLCERTELPWTAVDFRREWRKVADAAGVPSEVRNTDSRSLIEDDDSEPNQRLLEGIDVTTPH